MKTVTSLSRVSLSLRLTFLAVVTFALYSFDLGGSFRILDDQASILHNPRIQDFAQIKNIFTSSFFGEMSFYRPLVSLSFLVEYHLFKTNPFFYYLDNILLHLLAAGLIFLLTRKLFSDENMAWLAAFIFAIHPIHWEAVASIPGRAILLSGFFYLAAFYFFILYREKKAARFFVLSLGAFALSLLAKESAVTFPILLLSYLVVIGNKEKREWLKIFVPVGIVVLVYLTIRHSLKITHMVVWQNPAEAFLGVATFLSGVLATLKLLVFPVGLHFDRSLPLYRELNDVHLWFTLLAVAAVASLFFLRRKKLPPLVVFGVSWFLIDLLTVSQLAFSVEIQPGYSSTADHFYYTSLAGLLIAVMVAGKKVWAAIINAGIKKMSCVVLLTAYLLFLSAFTIRQSVIASNELALYKQALAHAPYNTRVRQALGVFWALHGRFSDAEKEFRKVIAENPADFQARINLGKAISDQGRYWEGLEEYQKVPAENPFASLLKRNKELTFQLLITKYLKAILDNPRDARLYYSLGVVYVQKGEQPAAVEKFSEALTISPEDRNTLYNLATTFAAMGKADEAERYFQQLLSQNLNDDLTLASYKNLAALYFSTDKMKSEGFKQKAQALESVLSAPK